MVHAFGAVLMMLVSALQTPAEPVSGEEVANERKETAPAGIWPTPKMLQGMMFRWAEDSGVILDLNDEQTERLGDHLVRRFQPFFDEHRETLQPLINEYLESQLSREAPEVEAVKSWADRALPMFELVQEEILESQREFAEQLNAAQRAKLAAESLKVSAGLQVIQAKLKAWQRGEFEEREWWDPPMSVQRRRERDRDAAEAAAAKAAGPTLARKRVEGELAKWDQYVADAAGKYQFDDGQRRAAESILRECRERALGHLDRYRARMETLEKQLQDGKAGQDEVSTMYAPVDEVFAELKSRIGQIPTTAQTSHAAEAPTSTGEGP